MVLTLWNRERYEQQWRNGIQRLLSGASRSCLISSLWKTQNKFEGEWWTIYRQEDRVAVRNQLIRPSIFNQNFANFDPDDPYPSIPDRQDLTEDGQHISEWSLPFSQITPLAPLK